VLEWNMQGNKMCVWVQMDISLNAKYEYGTNTLPLGDGL